MANDKIQHILKQHEGWAVKGAANSYSKDPCPPKDKKLKN